MATECTVLAWLQHTHHMWQDLSGPKCASVHISSFSKMCGYKYYRRRTDNEQGEAISDCLCSQPR